MGGLLEGSFRSGATRRDIHVELYSSFLKLAPLVLLKILATGGFGRSVQAKDRTRGVAVAVDLVLVMAVVGGGFIAIFVLGDVLTPTASTRGVLVVSACASLLVLAKFKLTQIASLYRARPGTGRLAGASVGSSDDPGESS
jgi:hypothetical protein